MMIHLLKRSSRGQHCTMYYTHLYGEIRKSTILLRMVFDGGDWERYRPQGLKNVHNFLMTVRPLSWASGHGTEMYPILKKLFLTWLFPDIIRYDSPKKCPTILYADNLWLKPVSTKGATCEVTPPWLVSWVEYVSGFPPGMFQRGVQKGRGFWGSSLRIKKNIFKF